MNRCRWIAALSLSLLAVACGGSYAPAPPPAPQETADVSVRVAGVEWRRVRSFDASGPNDPHFVVSRDKDGGATIAFGDGIRGRRPPAGSTVGITYRYGGGDQGDVRVNVERVMGAPAQALCLVLRGDARRFQFRPCE